MSHRGRKRRRGARRRGPHGVLAVDKPAGPTSFEAMRRAQHAVDAGRAGHGGTLDPAASGLLLVLLGEATKLSPWIMAHDKLYVATVRLGVGTTTLDAEGEVASRAAVPDRALDPERIEARLPAFVGRVRQRPPVYSALKQGGRTHMERARAGEEVQPEPRDVVCHDLELLWAERAADDPDAGRLSLRIRCGSGYYARSLARDLGEALGAPSHLEALRREGIGPWSAAGAVPPDAASPRDLVPLDRALPDAPRVPLDERDAAAVRNGRSVPARHEGDHAMLLEPSGRPIAVAARTSTDHWRVARGFHLPDEPAPDAGAGSGR